jgi:hypothetical protein
MADAPAAVRFHNLDGISADLGTHGHLSLGQLARALQSDTARQGWISQHAEHGAWFAGLLPRLLDTLAKLRNPGAHAARVGQEAALHWRNQLLGVGCLGLLVELGRVRPRQPA